MILKLDLNISINEYDNYIENMNDWIVDNLKKSPVIIGENFTATKCKSIIFKFDNKNDFFLIFAEMDLIFILKN